MNRQEVQGVTKDEAWQVGHMAAQLSFTCYRATAILANLSTKYCDSYREEAGGRFSSLCAFTTREHNALPLALSST